MGSTRRCCVGGAAQVSARANEVLDERAALQQLLRQVAGLKASTGLRGCRAAERGRTGVLCSRVRCAGEPLRSAGSWTARSGGELARGWRRVPWLTHRRRLLPLPGRRLSWRWRTTPSPRLGCRSLSWVRAWQRSSVLASRAAAAALLLRPLAPPQHACGALVADGRPAATPARLRRWR